METDTLALKLVRRVVTALAIATASACVMAAAVPRYAITDLGTLGGNNESYGFGINNRGDVAGKSCSIGAWPCEGFTYSRNSGTQGIGTVGATSSTATDINDSGKIVLSTWDSSGNMSRAYVAQLGSAPQDLGTLGGSRSQGAAINDAGQAVGASYLAGNSRIHAFLYTPGGPLVDLGTLGGSLSAATDISDVGSVVGAANLATGLRRAFYWSPGVGMVALPTTGPGESMATGINDYEQT